MKSPPGFTPGSSVGSAVGNSRACGEGRICPTQVISPGLGDAWVWDGPVGRPRSPPAWDGSDFPGAISQRVADEDLVLNERLLMPGGNLAPLICLPARHRPEDFTPCYKHFTSYYISEVLPGLTAALSIPIFHSSFFLPLSCPPQQAELPFSPSPAAARCGCRGARWRWGAL